MSGILSHSKCLLLWSSDNTTRFFKQKTNSSDFISLLLYIHHAIDMALANRFKPLLSIAIQLAACYKLDTDKRRPS
jgi:hypothetical protein